MYSKTYSHRLFSINDILQIAHKFHRQKTNIYNIQCFQSTLEVYPDYNKEIYKLNILPVSFISSFQIKVIIQMK